MSSYMCQATRALAFEKAAEEANAETAYFQARFVDYARHSMNAQRIADALAILKEEPCKTANTTT